MANPGLNPNDIQTILAAGGEGDVGGGERMILFYSGLLRSPEKILESCTISYSQPLKTGSLSLQGNSICYDNCPLFTMNLRHKNKHK